MDHSHATPATQAPAAPEQSVASTPGPAAPMPLPVGRSAPMTIRRAWAYRADAGRTNAERDTYHWYGVPGEQPDRVPSPALRFRLVRGAPITATPDQEGRFERGELSVPGAFNTMNYLNLRGGVQTRASTSSPLNPFGRFNSDITRYAYLPQSKFAPQTPQEVAGDDGRLPVVAISDDRYAAPDSTLWPLWVTAGVDGAATRLDLIATDPFGATYGPANETPILATGARQSTGMDTAGAAGADALPLGAQLIFGSVAGVAPTDTATVTKETLATFRGARGGEASQDTIMGIGANAVAALAGLSAVDSHYGALDGAASRKNGYNWLHLLAYHLGGGTDGPQVARNLVVGTSAANTWMIMIENLVSDLVHRGDVSVAVIRARPEWLNRPLRIASVIQYLVELRLTNGATVRKDLSFDAQTTQTPHVATHRHYRREFDQLITDTLPISEEAQAMYD